MQPSATMGSGGALGVNKGFNFAQPGRKEAYWITALSLGIAAIFWMICLYSASTGHGTLSIIENGLESLLDFGSTAIVLYRLSEPDALRHSVRNEIMEARVSVLLGFVMTILGLALCVLSALSLVYADHIGPGDISIEAALSVPASLMYIVVGMLQLQIAWALDLRSLKQDAIISLLGALIAMGSLAAALTNLIQCALPLPPSFHAFNSSHAYPNLRRMAVAHVRARPACVHCASRCVASRLTRATALRLCFPPQMGQPGRGDAGYSDLV